MLIQKPFSKKNSLDNDNNDNNNNNNNNNDDDDDDDDNATYAGDNDQSIFILTILEKKSKKPD